MQTVDANNRAKIYWYDSLGRVYKSKDPYKGQVTYAYGANGQLKNRTDAKGQVITYQYDALNRLTAKTFSDDRQITWTYDQTPTDDAIHTNGIGRLTSYQDKSGTTQLGYDAAGNLIAKQHGGLNLAFGYDQQDRLRGISYPNNYHVNYQYDALGLTQVVSGNTVLASYTDRNAFGQAQSIEYANGVKSSFDYDTNNGQLKSIKAGNGYLLNLSYGYDANGNVENIQDLTPMTGYHPVSNNEHYIYDTINRLIDANGPYGSMSYAYDAVGNITAKENVNFIYNDAAHPNAVTSTSNGYQATYDDNGNMIARTDSFGNTYDLVYDEENQLTRITKNNNYSEEYTYDATGYRVARNIGSTRTDYVYWGNTLLYESTQGKPIDYVWAEGKLIAKVEQAGTTYFTHDHLGSSKLQTDDQGRVLSLDVTKPFGPRICDESFKEDFASAQKIDMPKSTIIYKTGEIRPTAEGIAQKKLVANNSVVTTNFVQVLIKKLSFRLTSLDKDLDREVMIHLNVYNGSAKVKLYAGNQLYDSITTSNNSDGWYSFDLSQDPDMLYTVTLELSADSSIPAMNTVFEVIWGNTGKNLGEFYSLPYNLQEEARSVRLSWAGNNVAMMISTDGWKWESVENGKVVLLKNPGRTLYVKGLLPLGANTVLSGYQIEVNPAKYSLFTGKTLEESTGLVYFGRRWYDPEIGRFITVDPAGQGENWYSYCFNNPVMLYDPDGRVVPFILELLFSAGFGACLSPPDATPTELFINMGACAIGGAAAYKIPGPMFIKGAGASGLASLSAQAMSNRKANWSLVAVDTAVGGLLGLGGDGLSRLTATKPIGGRDFEIVMEREYANGAKAQQVFRNGEVIATGRPRPNATTPDLFNFKNLISIEGKSYDVSTNSARNRLVNDICTQARKRIFHLPKGSTQVVFIDLRGQRIPKSIVTDLERDIISKSSGLITKVNFVYDRFNYYVPYTSTDRRR